MPSEDADDLELHAVKLINSEREAAGLDLVEVEVHLNSAAQDHSDWMASEQVLSHTGSGDSSPGERVEDAEFVLSGSWKVTENVAYRSFNESFGETEIEEIHAALMNSKAHRDNVLDPEVSYIGVGISTGQMDGGNGPQDVLFLTQNFAETTSPVSLQIIEQDEEVPALAIGSLSGSSQDPGIEQDEPSDQQVDGADAEDEDDNESSSSSDSACFVATAAYGDRMHPDVVALRAYRDQTLSHYAAGRMFIKFYWIVGPKMAKLVHPERLSGRVARLILRPFVSGAKRSNSSGVSIL